jgi:hypothetical protein
LIKAPINEKDLVDASFLPQILRVADDPACPERRRAGVKTMALLGGSEYDLTTRPRPLPGLGRPGAHVGLVSVRARALPARLLMGEVS